MLKKKRKGEEELNRKFDIFKWTVENINNLEISDRLKVLDIIVKTASDFEPIYKRYNK